MKPRCPACLKHIACAVMALVVILAVWRGLSGWWLRALAAACLLAALANPSLQQEDREPLTDIVILVVDESASQKIADRAQQTAQAVADVEAAIAALPNTELRTVRVGDAVDLTDASTIVLQPPPYAQAPARSIPGFGALSAR